MLAQTSPGEITEEEKVFERNDRFGLKTSANNNNNNKKIYMNKYHISSDFISLGRGMHMIFATALSVAVEIYIFATVI